MCKNALKRILHVTDKRNSQKPAIKIKPLSLRYANRYYYRFTGIN